MMTKVEMCQSLAVYLTYFQHKEIKQSHYFGDGQFRSFLIKDIDNSRFVQFYLEKNDTVTQELFFKNVSEFYVEECKKEIKDSVQGKRKLECLVYDKEEYTVRLCKKTKYTLGYLTKEQIFETVATYFDLSHLRSKNPSVLADIYHLRISEECKKLFGTKLNKEDTIGWLKKNESSYRWTREKCVKISNLFESEEEFKKALPIIHSFYENYFITRLK